MAQSAPLNREDALLLTLTDSSGLSIDTSAEKAPKTTQMLKAWAAKRIELESGEITPEEYADWKAKF